jgi:hypothetical protein
MKISEENKKLIIDEIKIVLKSMKESKSPAKMVFFFSGISGMLQRIFNLEYDPDLVFAHVILKMTHDNFSQKILNPDPVIQLEEKHFDKLCQLSENFCEKIENGQDFVETLKAFTILVYSIGGNGYYLTHKGLLKI